MNDERRTSEHDTGSDPGAHGNGGDYDEGFGVFGGDELRESLLAAEPRVRELLASHPVPLLLGALAAGYLLARLVRRVDS